MTLAYLFWHWPRPGVPAPDYERRQRPFHAALAEVPPDGFTKSLSFAVSGAPWAAGGGDAYEDWYLVDSFGALGTLNDAAVTASRRLPHDKAAALAADGAGGVYRLRLGSLAAEPRWAYWLAKPEGMGYEELWRLLQPLVAGGAAVWLRQMVLGPGRELCVHSATEISLPTAVEALRIPLRRVWP
jgi:hypothetical protein